MSNFIAQNAAQNGSLLSRVQSGRSKDMAKVDYQMDQSGRSVVKSGRSQLVTHKSCDRFDLSFGDHPVRNKFRPDPEPLNYQVQS